MKEKLLAEIRQALADSADPQTKFTSGRFFKPGEAAQVYGVKTARVNQIAKGCRPQIKACTKQEVFALCNHTIGSFVMKYPEYIEELKRWATSLHRWTKRGAAVSLIIPARKGLFLKEIFEIADLLLLDTDDLMQKGYGWMLKAASESRQQAVFDYVAAKKALMPRTALRYAIEKMPQALKEIAMKK